MDKNLPKKFTGTHWWADSKRAKEDKITRAIIRNKDKEIAIDYQYEGKQEWLKLCSDDGIYFTGEYGSIEKNGDCEFTLYKNEKEWLLFGGLTEDGEPFDWFIKLKPEI